MAFILPFYLFTGSEFGEKNDTLQDLRDKAEKKYRKLCGNEWFDELMQFAEYDRIASGTYKHYQEK